MFISGVVSIANKWENNQVIKGEYQFDKRQLNNGNTLASGKISYSSSKKVDGKWEKTYSSKTFNCFDNDIIAFLESSLGKLIEIEGILKVEQYTNKEGKKQTIEKIIINRACLKQANNPTNQSLVAEEQDDEILFN